MGCNGECYKKRFDECFGQVVHTLNSTATQFAAHSSAVVSSGLTIAATIGFVPGLLTGLKKG